MALNLPRDFTEQQLAELFKWYGNIKACTLVLDETTGKSKGFGFVEMGEYTEENGIRFIPMRKDYLAEI